MRAWAALVIVALGCIAGLMPAVSVSGSSSTPATAADRLADALSGDGTTLHLLGGLLVYGGFAFVVQLRESDEARGMLLQRLLRHGSASHWARTRVTRHAVSAVAYLGALAVLGLATAMLTGSRALAPSGDRWGLLIWHYAVNGTLQLLVYALAAITVTWLARSAAAGLLTVGLVVAGGALQVETRPWLPVQLADMAVTRAGWGEVMQVSVTLGLTAAVLTVGLASVVRIAPPA